MKTRDLSLSLRHVGGFTLIELMVAVSIVAILATVAVPQYSDYIIRGRIPQATNNLSVMRVRLEQYYQDNRTYVGACSANTVAPLPVSDDFEYSCPTLTANAFTVLASGADTSQMKGFSYTINESNARVTTAVPNSKWGSVPVGCWVTKKGGQC